MNTSQTEQCHRNNHCISQVIIIKRNVNGLITITTKYYIIMIQQIIQMILGCIFEVLMSDRSNESQLPFKTVFHQKKTLVGSLT